MSSDEINKLAQELVNKNLANQKPEEQAESASTEEQEVEVSQSEQEATEQQDLIEFKAVGETHKLPLEEIKNLAAKGLDYTRKTQEIPERVRQETEKQVLERTRELQAERNRLLESCSMVESFYGQPFVTADQLDQLIQDGDTETYLKLSRQEEKRREILDKAKQERQKVLEAQTKEQQEQFTQAAIQHTKLLFEKMPELQDVGNQGKLANYLKSSGLTDKEIAEFVDHRGLIIAEKARRYDELAGGKIEPARPAPPKVIKKVGATVNKQTYTQKELDESSKRLAKTGNLRDAASLLLKMRQTGV